MRMPAEVFPPGDRLKEELEARGWTQADLAEILGRPPRLVSEIITAKRAITPETAQGLGEALGTGPELWMNLEGQYQLSQTRIAHEPIALRAMIFGQFPVKEMQKRGWLKPTSQLREIEAQLKQYFSVSSLDDGILIPHAAKKTSYDKLNIQQAAWLVRARQLAPKVATEVYLPSNLPRLYEDLRRCAQLEEDAAKVPDLLSKAGIQLLIIEPLPGSKIDAACLWIDEQPLIVLTLRYDRHDIFWHALFHELDHIAHGEGKSAAIVDSNLMAECSHGARAERRANETAASRLIPTDELERIISTMSQFYSEATILDLATRLKIHPGIVVGQLQHRQLLPWSAFTRLKAKIRHVITKTAVTDGFGKGLG